MYKIHMVDLVGQYKNIREQINSSVIETFESGEFINGRPVSLFREELAAYLNVKHVISCANGTDALQAALMALDLQPGDEVITSNFTFIATAEVIGLLKLKPVLVDVDPMTFNIDPGLIRKAITDKTKAIVPVHLFGQAADMNEILNIGSESGIPVIEDSAQATGARYKFPDGRLSFAGTMGDIGTTSFFPSKNLGCFGDGGALLTNNDSLAEKLQMIVNHGSKIKYHHEIIGMNSRLDTVQAAILRIKLKNLDRYNEARKLAAVHYDSKLGGHPGIIIPRKSGQGDHIYHQYTLRVLNGKRDELKAGLAKDGIPSMVYYPVPLSLQKAFRSTGFRGGEFPVSEMLCSEVLSLPMHTELSPDQLDYIINRILANL